MDTDSEDDDLFTGNVWWEGAGGQGQDNAAFVPDDKPKAATEKPKPAPAPAPEPPAEPEEPPPEAPE